MRIKKSMKNMAFIYGSTLLIAIMNLVVRRIFLDVLTVDYLGYDSLFMSIFSILSLSEMGIASIITYHMYAEIATNNTEQIRKLLYIYKMIYRVVGLFVLVVGIIASLFIPFILRGEQNESWLFIYTIYFLQLMATLCTYFLAYRRVLFTTDQRIYVCTAVDTVVNIVAVFLKMAVLLWLRNYIVYLLIAIAANVISNLVIARKSYKEYPEITRIDVTREDVKQLNLLHEAKNMLATKVAATIYGSSDDIIITAILGVGMDGLLSNYRMISAKILELIIAMFNSLQASIGNMIYTEDDKEKAKAFFGALDLVGFFLAIVCAVAVISVGQPFIILWLKNEKYLLPYAFLILLSVNMFFAIANYPMNYFRNSLGHFETDRNYMIAAAIVNVVITAILCFPLGITGVMLGTVAGHALIFMGRTVVVYKYFLEDKPQKYYAKFAIRLCMLALASFISVALGNLIGGALGELSSIGMQIVNVLIRGIIAVVVATLVFAVGNLRTDEMKMLWRYVRAVIDTIRGRA